MIKLGLRSKFFLYSNTLIVVTMTLMSVLAMVHERESQYEAIDRRGRSIVEAMAIPISNGLRQRTQEGLGAALVEGYPDQILERNPDVMRYVVICDHSGRVVYSSDGGPAQCQPLPGPALGGVASLIREPEGGERFLEVRSQLGEPGAPAGSLTVGFSLEPVERRVADVARRAVQVALVLMLGNSLLTAVYVETLIRPILRLNQTMKRAGSGDLSVRAPPRRGDEVGELTDAFNRMMDELEDLSELEEVRRLQLAHTEKMVAVGTLAAGVAHEVNNPLSGVLACIEAIKANPDDVAMRHQYLDLIRDGLKRIERTVVNLLGFSRQRQLRPEPTSINHNLQHVVELAEYQLHQAGVDVEWDLDSDEAVVMADHFQMEQLFLNLVLNAVQAMPDGGTLSLRTRVRDGKVVAEVRDTGSGIADDIRDQIFDPFFTTRGVGEGTGLGLAVSDSIVAAHQGTIEVESTVGKGTVFRVVFEGMKIDTEAGETS